MDRGWPNTYRIKKIVKENPIVKTFYFDLKVEALPGQFVMVWMPGVDEKPMAITKAGKELAFTVQEHGYCSKEILKLKEGDFLGVRGPFGKAFTYEKVKKACLIGGGVGIPPLAMLAELLSERGTEVTTILGGRSKDRLMFEKRLEKAGKLLVSTDDGSKGFKGYSTDLFEQEVKKNKFDLVYTCGPEVMMEKIAKSCVEKGIKCEASIERFMKCAFAVCGHCTLDDKLVCMDGPVFDAKFLVKTRDFGKYALLKTGKRCELKDYYEWYTPGKKC